MTSDALRGMRIFSGQRVQRTDLPSSPARCPMAQCVYCQAGLCDEASINKGNCDAACHRMNNRRVLAMLQQAERNVSAQIMTVLGGRVTTNVELLPKALRTNRPTRAEAEIAADVIERLYAELQAARRDARPAVDSADSGVIRLGKAIAEADPTLRAEAVEWLREDATSARDHDPNAGIHANRALADLLDAIADCLEEADRRRNRLPIQRRCRRMTSKP